MRDILGASHGDERVHRRSSPIKRVGEQVAVSPIDLRRARAHEAGELEERNAGGDRERGERVP
jgi:hypothetical protein